MIVSDDPFIVPIYLTSTKPAYGHRWQKFGQPFIAVVEPADARSYERIFHTVIDRLARWTVKAEDMFVWEKAEDTMLDESNNPVLQIAAVKNYAFEICLQAAQKDHTSGSTLFPSQCSVSWENRINEVKKGAPLLREWDAIQCELDEDTKEHFFGEQSTRWEYASWGLWEKFVHPEYTEAEKAGISINDCLKEFTKEERLGNDEPWYCPRCKKHQQATKEVDLWKTPNILAVHLKRFSNAQTFRDKVDAFVDFPIEGLDPTQLVGERATGKRLREGGMDIQELGIRDLDEPLIYDLYAVNEHLGRLDSGHYRAYAFHHAEGQSLSCRQYTILKTETTMYLSIVSYLLSDMAEEICDHSKAILCLSGNRTEQEITKTRMM